MGPFDQGWTEADIDAALQRGDPEELLYVPIVLGMNAPDCERGWVEGICFHLATHPHLMFVGMQFSGWGMSLAPAEHLIHKPLFQSSLVH